MGIPWLSIIFAVLTFLLSGGTKKGQAGRAALAAAGVGLGTYYVTHETDWGRENLGALDGVTTTKGPNGGTQISSGLKGDGSKLPNVAGGSAESGANAFWNSLGKWLTSPAGQVSTGAAAGKALGVPNWLLYGGAAVGAYLLLKD